MIRYCRSTDVAGSTWKVSRQRLPPNTATSVGDPADADDRPAAPQGPVRAAAGRIRGDVPCRIVGVSRRRERDHPRSHLLGGADRSSTSTLTVRAVWLDLSPRGGRSASGSYGSKRQAAPSRSSVFGAAQPGGLRYPSTHPDPWPPWRPAGRDVALTPLTRCSGFGARDAAGTSQP